MQTKSRIRPINTENKLMVVRGVECWKKTGEGEWELQTSSYGMNISCE